MITHLFISSRHSLLTGIILALLVMAVMAGLFILYGDLKPLTALTDAFIFIGLLAVCGTLSWYFFAYIWIWQAQAAFLLLVQLICLGVCYTVLSLFNIESAETFTHMLPLRLLIGIGSWVILMQWYRIIQSRDTAMSNVAETSPQQENRREISHMTESTMLNPTPTEWLDRISVKDGGRIHIVPLKDILYLQASGDYVTLFTHTGQYLKEQTMKYFDTHLPPSTFIRIHRSTIVNADQILRVELFGKESYNVRLKSGTNLRASVSGYKLLKEQLGL
ncbi:transcriptional regulator [Bacteroidia bacterium]|nr:transcriptional regulator [Bacteroidia bacterium]